MQITKSEAIFPNTDNAPQIQYPVCHNPAEFLKCREGRFISGFLKRIAERRALNECLRGLENVTSVLDVPCGAGRLFSYWGSKMESVSGIDLSDEMLGEASNRHRKLNLNGMMKKGNAFELASHMEEYADLVSCVRFCYYFDAKKRQDLLASLKSASKRYIIVQYKTSETPKSRRNQKRVRPSSRPAKYFCHPDQIANEIAQAGLLCKKIVPIGMFSDRAFVLAEKM